MTAGAAAKTSFFYALAAAALLLSAALYGLRAALGSGIVFAACSVIIFAIAAAAAFAFGARALESCGFEWDSFPGLRVPAAATLGLGALALAVFALGEMKLLYPTSIVLLLGAFLWSGRKRLVPFPVPGMVARTGWELAALLPLAGAFLVCFAPPPHYDSLVYHLALPQAYALNHAIAPVPGSVYSHFPQNSEMLFTAALLLGSDTAAQLFSWLCAALSGLWVYGYLRTLENSGEASPGASGLALFLALSHTSFALLASASYAETAACLFITAAVLSLAMWRRNAGPQSRLWAAAGGVFCGLAFGTKYYAGITAAALLMLALRHCYSVQRFSERRARVVDVLIFAAACCLVCAPWLVKNAAETGNPVYPFLYRLLNADTALAGQAQAYFSMLTEYGGQGRPLRELIMFPYTLFTAPSHFGGGMDALGTLGWNLFFAATPLMALAALRSRELRWCGAYILLHFAVWFFTAKVLRFLVVIVPLGSILAAEGFMAARREGGRLAGIVLAAALLAFAAERAVLWAGMNDLAYNWNYLFGKAGRAEHLSATLRYYPCAAAVNAMSPPGARVLMAGEQRSYYVRRNVAATALTAQNGFVTAANAAASPLELAQTLARDYDWVIYVPGEMRRLHPYGTLNFSENGLKNWEEMLSVQPAFAAESCALYRL
ncbi:MAG: phospholipid carrier-dependent glycosyltransferase [Elusimicrobiales bacterium]